MIAKSAGWRRCVAPYLVFVLLIVATVQWRARAYFEGTFDSVVVIKGLLSLVALAAAILSTRCLPKRPISAFPFLFLGVYLLTTLLGATSAGSPMASAVIVVRMVIIAATVAVLASRFQPLDLLGSLVAALGSVGAFGVLTGFQTLRTKGRLWGGIPPLHPNEVAFMSACAILWCTSRVVRGTDRLPHLLGLGLAAVILLLTGSRTSWLALGVGLLIVIGHSRALRLRTIWLLLAALPVVCYILLGTSIAEDVFRRGSGDAELLTLSNRTIAWQAALSPKATVWLDWLGGGLAKKFVEVPGQWWSQQILDSSWVSTVVQGGILGATICLAWIAFALVRAWRSTRGRARSLIVAMIAYLTVRGFAESGLFDASTAFMAVVAAQLALPAGYRKPATMLDDPRPAWRSGAVISA